MYVFRMPVLCLCCLAFDLTVSKALRRCKTSLNEKFKDVHRRTDTIIFLGTPHRGSSAATWGELASRLAAVALQDSNRNLFTSIAVESEILENINSEFMKMLHANDFHVHSFQEGRGATGIKGFSGKVMSINLASQKPVLTRMKGCERLFFQARLPTGNR